MKKQYIIAVLLLIGAATVSTMAFSVTDNVHEDFTLYDVTPAGGKVSVEKIRFRVMSSDVCYIKIDLAVLAGSDDGRFHIILQNEAGTVMDPNTFAITYGISTTTLGALDEASASGDDVLIVDVADVLAADYIMLRLEGSELIYKDGATTDLGSLTIAAYDDTDLTDAAGSWTDTEASDM